LSIIGVASRSNETEPETAKIRGLDDTVTSRERIANALAAYVKWIPAEVVVAYGAFVTANWDHQLDDIKKANPNVPAGQLPEPRPDAPLWWNALILCPIAMLALSLLGKNSKALIRKTLMAPIGFIVWSISLTNSWAASWDPIDGADWQYVGLWLVVGGAILALAGEQFLGWDIKEKPANSWKGWKRILRFL
jgi:hypothetical protein